MPSQTAGSDTTGLPIFYTEKAMSKAVFHHTEKESSLPTTLCVWQWSRWLPGGSRLAAARAAPLKHNTWQLNHLYYNSTIRSGNIIISRLCTILFWSYCRRSHNGNFNNDTGSIFYWLKSIFDIEIQYKKMSLVSGFIAFWLRVTSLARNLPCASTTIFS